MTPQGEGYSTTARIFHWVTAALVLTTLILGVLMSSGGEGPIFDAMYDLHRSLGAVLLPIALARLVYRIGHPPPPLPADIAWPQRFAAHFSHAALYIFL